MNVLKATGYTALLAVFVAVGIVLFQSQRTERDIDAFEARVASLGTAAPGPAFNASAIARLPEPVQRYFKFTFPDQSPGHSVVRLSAEGDFRRPLTETFHPTTAEQVIAIGVPALMFSATTPVFPGVWARAYDFFADGEMEMKAKILSTLTVVNEPGTPELNRISLRRWLLESALYPQALLPGGVVTWQPVDSNSARAVISLGDMRATMVAHFDSEGRMFQMVAEEEGDLSTPYHGSGEHVTRSDYQLVGGQMIPMRFTISRASGGKIYPFWDGRISSISYQ